MFQPEPLYSSELTMVTVGTTHQQTYSTERSPPQAPRDETSPEKEGGGACRRDSGSFLNNDIEALMFDEGDAVFTAMPPSATTSHRLSGGNGEDPTAAPPRSPVRSPRDVDHDATEFVAGELLEASSNHPKSFVSSQDDSLIEFGGEEALGEEEKLEEEERLRLQKLADEEYERQRRAKEDEQIANCTFFTAFERVEKKKRKKHRKHHGDDDDDNEDASTEKKKKGAAKPPGGSTVYDMPEVIESHSNPPPGRSVTGNQRGSSPRASSSSRRSTNSNGSSSSVCRKSGVVAPHPSAYEVGVPLSHSIGSPSVVGGLPRTLSRSPSSSRGRLRPAQSPQPHPPLGSPPLHSFGAHSPHAGNISMDSSSHHNPFARSNVSMNSSCNTSQSNSKTSMHSPPMSSHNSATQVMSPRNSDMKASSPRMQEALKSARVVSSSEMLDEFMSPNPYSLEYVACHPIRLIRSVHAHNNNQQQPHDQREPTVSPSQPALTRKGTSGRNEGGFTESPPRQASVTSPSTTRPPPASSREVSGQRNSSTDDDELADIVLVRSVRRDGGGKQLGSAVMAHSSRDSFGSLSSPPSGAFEAPTSVRVSPAAPRRM